MIFRRFVLALFAAAALLAVTVPVSAEREYPPGVPNLTDPDIQTEFVTLAVWQLNGDPDFPVLVLAGTNEGLPQLLLVIVDARNGKETWSLREDSPVFFMLFSDPTTVLQAYLDEGFTANGKPSGSFDVAGPEAAEELMAELRESHRRSRKPERKMVI